MESFGAIVLVYRQIDYIDWCLEAARKNFDRVLCMTTDIPFVKYNSGARDHFGGDDGSLEVVLAHAEEDSRVQVVQGRWDCEESMRTEALNILKSQGIDYTFVLDADELYPDGTLDRVKDWIRSHREHSRFQCRYRNLFKRMDYEIIADDLWHNVCYRNRDITSFERGRTIEIPSVRLPRDLFFWHFGWVLSDERIYEKVNTYSHSHELPEDWYQSKWVEWTPETMDLCARNKWDWSGTRHVDPAELPSVLQSHPRFPARRDVQGVQGTT